MNNRNKQLIVAALGLAFLSGGAMIRLSIGHHWVREVLSLITTFGQTKYRNTTDAAGAVSAMAMGLFYAGLVLLVLAVVAWLFEPRKQDTDG